MPRLSALPEELLESILAYSPHAPILRVSSLFYRIALPLYYHSIIIRSPPQLQRLLTHALRPNTQLASLIHHIVLPAICPDAAELLLRASSSLKSLDITLDSVLNSQAHDPHPELFCTALHHLTNLTHLVVRKPNNVYLTRPKLQYVLSEITNAIHNWPDLEYVDLAFRLSDDSGGTAALLTILPIPLPVHHRPRSTKLPGPVTQLTQVLASAPKLHTFSTHLPNVWNENILRVSQNPALQRIILVDGLGPTSTTKADSPGITGTGHFFAQARRYQRLSDLIRAGTLITRCRAQTTGRPSSNSGYGFGHQTPPPSPAPSRPSSAYYGTPLYCPPHAHAHALDRELASNSPSAQNNNNNHTWPPNPISRPWERRSISYASAPSSSGSGSGSAASFSPSSPSPSSTPGSNSTRIDIPMRASLPLSTSAP